MCAGGVAMSMWKGFRADACHRMILFSPSIHLMIYSISDQLKAVAVPVWGPAGPRRRRSHWPFALPFPGDDDADGCCYGVESRVLSLER
jgi:hypothetical protein